MIGAVQISASMQFKTCFEQYGGFKTIRQIVFPFILKNEGLQAIGQSRSRLDPAATTKNFENGRIREEIPPVLEAAPSLQELAKGFQSQNTLSVPISRVKVMFSCLIVICSKVISKLS